jgi:formate dehydrogenase alpha subunit
MLEPLRLSINGTRLTCRPGISVLDAAVENGFNIPTLCHHPALKPHGACRLCLVEDAASGRLFASCVTPVVDSMAVLTHSPRVVEHQKTIVGLMLAAHPESCLVCAKGNTCDLRRIAGELGIGFNTFDPMPKISPQDQGNPFIWRDTSKCILCGKCIRACKELVVNGTLEYSGRGFDSRPQSVFDTKLSRSDCTFCGTCVTVCPTGALLPASSVFSGTAARRMETVCGFCGTGCRLSAGVSGNRITDVKPSETASSVNGVTACVRGLFAQDYRDSEKRLTSAMKRKGDAFEKIPLNLAIAETVQTLRRIKDTWGPDSIGFYGSSKCSNEENYLFQKIAREALGTRHIDNGGTIYGRKTMQAFDALTSGAFRHKAMADMEKAEAVIMVGADTASSSPVLGYHIKRAVKSGAVLVILDRTKSAMTLHSSLWLKPGFTVEPMDAYAQLIRSIRSNLTGAEAPNESRLAAAASLIRGKRTALILGEAVLEHPKGAQVAAECADLYADVHGGLENGGGVYLIARENNLLGSWDMGTVPDQEPGRIPAKNPGLDIHGMIAAAAAGQLKALFILGENPMRNLPRPDAVRKALENLEFLAVQDILETETTALAHLILPGAAATEKSGSFTSMEGRVQTFTRVVDPPGEAISDYNLLCRLADQLGLHMNGIDVIREEIGQRVRAYRDLAENPAFFWPAWDTMPFGHPGYSRQPEGGHDGVTNASAYPYTVLIRHSRFHAGSGTRTSHSARISRAATFSGITASPSVAVRHGLADGSKITVTSGHGRITRTLAVDSDLDDGVIGMPSAAEDSGIMALSGDGSSGCRVAVVAGDEEG